MLCVSSAELISGCNPPGECPPSRIPGRLGWQLGAYSQFGGGCISRAEIAPCPLALAVACLPLCLWRGKGQVCNQLALLWYWLNPLFCKWTRLCLRLELFAGNFSLCLCLCLCLSISVSLCLSVSLSLSLSLCLWLTHSLVCFLMLAPSDCHQGIQTQSLP